MPDRAPPRRGPGRAGRGRVARVCFEPGTAPVAVDAPAVAVDAPLVALGAPAIPVDAPLVAVDGPAVPVDAPLVAVVVLGARLIPPPNRVPEPLDPVGPPRAVASGIAYCLAAGLPGSMWTPGGALAGLAASDLDGQISATCAVIRNTKPVGRSKWCLLLRKPFLPRGTL